MEEQEFTIFEVKIPAAVLPLLEYAAKADGWQPTLPDGSPNRKAQRRGFSPTRCGNPPRWQLTPWQRSGLTRRQQTVNEMTVLSQQWLAAMAQQQQ